MISFRKCKRASGAQAERASVISAFLQSAGSACPPHSSSRPIRSRRRSHMHTASHSKIRALDAPHALQPYTACGSMFLQDITSAETRPPTALTLPTPSHTQKQTSTHMSHMQDSAAYQICKHGNPPGVRLQSHCLNLSLTDQDASKAGRPTSRRFWPPMQRAERCEMAWQRGELCR